MSLESAFIIATVFFAFCITAIGVVVERQGKRLARLADRVKALEAAREVDRG